jgi:murein DD-endopeptidase MepM/ murein hydrolase activator NlpD
MGIYSISVRAAIVATAGVIIIEGTPVGRSLVSALGPVLAATLGPTLGQTLSSNRDSDRLLLDPASPFQNTDLTASEAPLTPEIQEQGARNLIPAQPLQATEEFKYTIKKGSNLASLWQELKGAPRAVSSFIKAFTSKNSKLRAGEVVSVTRKGSEVIELRRELGAGATLVISGGADEGYVPRIEQALVHSTDRKVSGTIFSSLVDAARGIDMPYSVVDDFVDLFSNRVDFRKDLQPGDTFTVWFEESRLDDGRVLSTGSIKAASISLQGKMYAVVRDRTSDGTVRYFDEKGEMPTKSFLRYPVQFTRISSVFTHARFHPVLKISRPHNGIDFAAPVGTPVRTVGDGVVLFAGWNTSGGNMIKIAHDSRYTTEYMHLSKIAPTLKKGARVTRGSIIGALGNTGLSSGPHLHFGLFDKGSYVDPMKAKIIQSAPDMKAPKSVYALIAEMKRTHQSIALASNITATSSSSKKKA